MKKTDQRRPKNKTSPSKKARSPAASRSPRSTRSAAQPAVPDTAAEPRLLNRELSWLEFNERVLEEARNKNNPLLERVRFLAITCSNLDEFFMIRVASLKDQVHAGYDRPDPAGLDPKRQLSAIAERTHEMVNRQYSTLNRVLLPALLKQGIRLVRPRDLDETQRQFVAEYFRTTVFPVLTPMAVDAGRPFPLIANRSINICVRIDPLETGDRTGAADEAGGRTSRYAIIQVPSVIPRLIALPPDRHDYLLLEDAILMHLDALFSGVEIGPAGCFRIMRNADLDIDEEEAADLLTEIEKQIKLRQWGEVIRLEAADDLNEDLLRWLVEALAIGSEEVYEIDGPLDLTLLNALASTEKRPDLSYPRYVAPDNRPLPDLDLFSAIRQQDMLFYHPFDSFAPIIDLMRSAARDPEVLAIKQTLYRVSGNSPVVRMLAEAAENGKQVMVLVELKARFDEENNIQWARRLERAGCHVIYGLAGLKTHSKITLVVRREEDGIRRYVHLGTGNYNDLTARVYTDFGLLTCAESIGRDASAFFNMLSGYSAPAGWNRLVPAPYWLRRDLLRRIDREIEVAKAGRQATIILKTNALVDEEMIEKLYAASSAGVRIDLIIRGICCLRPGVPGLSENIQVRSIVGRFLEHARVFYFHNDGEEDLFLSSADWMPRNLDRRVELMFPIEDRQLHRRVMEIIRLQFADTDRAHLMNADGTYARVDRRGKTALDSQVELCRQALEQAAGWRHPLPENRFEPIEADDVPAQVGQRLNDWREDEDWPKDDQGEIDGNVDEGSLEPDSILT